MSDYKAAFPVVERFRLRAYRLLQLVPGFSALLLARYQARFMAGAYRGAGLGSPLINGRAVNVPLLSALLEAGMAVAAIGLILTCVFFILARRVFLSWLVSAVYLALSLSINLLLANRYKLYRKALAALGLLAADPLAAFSFAISAFLSLSIILLSWRSLHRSSFRLEMGKGVMLGSQFLLVVWSVWRDVSP